MRMSLPTSQSRGQASAYIKLRDFRTPVKLNFLVCLDEGEEALLCLDTLKDLSIVSPDFPRTMDKTRLESRTRRVRMEKEELLELVESEEQRRHKQTREHCTLRERVGSLRSHLELKEMNKEEWEDEKACNELREKWLADYDDVFKEDWEETDRIQMEPVVVDLMEKHQEIEMYHPKTPLDVPAYLEEAARKELQRMLAAGMLEPVQGYTATLSRGFFV